MSRSATLVQGIKARLKIQGISYRELSRMIGISEPTVKRDLARGNFSLERLDRICDALGVSLTELMVPADSEALTELSERQEQALVTNPRALVVTYLVINDWTFDEIVSTFRLDDNQLVSLLLQLDSLRIVDFRPPKRMRKLTARNFSWRKDGAVQDYFIRRVMPEFDQMAHHDARLSLEQRLSCSAILALRACEFSEFSKLRREPKTRQALARPRA